MSPKVMLVDDEENILHAYLRTFRKRFQVDTALGGREALYRLSENGPYAVVVTDMRMPEMDGVQLLEELRQRSPDTVRIMLTGNSDQHTAMEAVNRGSIFRFLTKPCDGEDLATAIRAGLEQYRLVTAEKELLERTLKGAILMLGELLSMLDPGSFGRSQQVAELARDLAEDLGMSNAWMMEVSAILAHIGLHTLPPSVLSKLQGGGFLGAVEREMCQRVPEIGANLIRCIPRLDDVATIVYYAQKNYNGTGFPADELRGDLIPLGARILRVASDHVSLVAQRGSPAQVLQDMAGRQAWYDGRVIHALQRVLAAKGESEAPSKPVHMSMDTLRVGHRLAEEVVTLDGWMVLPRNTVLGRTHLEKMKNFQRLAGLREPIKVFEEGV